MSATATPSPMAIKAMRLYTDGQVTEVPQTRVFYVRGDHGTYHVTISPNLDTHCGCPARLACSHIGAALLAAGLVDA